jgi:hypothetical protein
MTSVITEDTEPRLPPRPIIFEAPRAIADRVARELAAYNEETRQRTLAHWTLDYYFRDMPPGVDVAYRPHPRGAEVLALGFQEVMDFQKDMPVEEQRQYTFEQTQ